MEEKDLKKIMQQARLEIKFPDFDETVMQKIKAKEANRKSVWKNLKISWLFFFLGAFFGIIVTQFLADVQLPYLKENSKLVLLIGQILIVLVVSTQFDSLFGYTFRKRE